MNAQELIAHYAAVKNRIAPRRASVVSIKIPPKTEESSLSKEQRKIALLAYGMPAVAPDVRSSIVSMLLAYNVSWFAIIGKGRRHRICMCRRAITWVLYLRGWSHPKIGKLMQCDHSSSVYAVHKANSWAYTNNKRLQGKIRHDPSSKNTQRGRHY